MGNAKDFVTRITEIDGVAGCLLFRKNEMLFGKDSEALRKYSHLMVASEKFVSEIMTDPDFGNCRYLSFNQNNNRHFYVFLINNFFLGVAQNPDCQIPEMLDAIFNLIGRVSTGKSHVNRNGS